MRISFYAGIILIIASAIWSAPLLPLWFNVVQSQLSFIVVGHSLLAVGCFLFGLTLSLSEYFRYNKYKKWLSIHARVDALKSMPWEEFERIVEATFKQWGFRVQVKGGGHADGGIDLIAYKKGKRYLVQCKRYKGSVGVSIIREIFGVMVAEKFDGAYIVTSGKFTKESLTFAKGKPMKLISGEVLARTLDKVSSNL